jgi:hypothetical protein
MTLVKFVENDRADAAERGVERHLTQENSLSHEADARFRAHARLEAYLVSNDVPERSADLLRDPFRKHTRRKTTGLEHDDFVVLAEEPVLQ